jgi:hypothetical protein
MLVGETATRYFYRPRSGDTAYVSKRSPSIHLQACEACADYDTSPSTLHAP